MAGDKSMEENKMEVMRCPFCDGEAEIQHYYDYGDQFYIQCKECECRTGNCNTQEKALRAWNNRSLMFYYMPQMFGTLTAVYEAAKDHNSLFFDPEFFPVKVENIIGELLKEMNEARKKGKTQCQKKSL